MLDKLVQVENRYNELTAEMARPEVASDYTKLAEYGRERSELEPVVTRYRVYRDVLSQIEEARALLEEDDAEMVELAQARTEARIPPPCDIGEILRSQQED